MKANKLKEFGYDEYFEKQYRQHQQDGYPARVIALSGDIYKLQTEQGIIDAKVIGKFMHKATMNKDYPVVGDFVIAIKLSESNNWEIVDILHRKNHFSRKMPISGGRKMRNGIVFGGTTEEQVMVANIDYIFILSSFDTDFSIARLERYILQAKISKAHVVIVITKMDLFNESEKHEEVIREIGDTVEIARVSSITSMGLDELTRYICKEKTIVFLGSSGVGKSTLLNALFQEKMQLTKELSGHSGKGRHTTTARKMFFHSSGGMIIDTPGIKELQLWATEDDLEYIYPDIFELIVNCKYSNCNHNSDAGCAVSEAIEKGILSKARYKRYKKMVIEIRTLDARKREHTKQAKRGK